MKNSRVFLAFVLCTVTCCSRDDERKAVADLLAKAMVANDLNAIRAAVTAGHAMFGDKTGIPEVADEYVKAPADATLLTQAQAQRGFTPGFAKLETMKWWNVGVDPATLTAPLRAPASVLSGGVATFRAKLDGAEQSLAMAKEAAEFLIWAQAQAGAGCYPFPAARGTSDARAMEVATRFLKQAEKVGKLDTVVRNGWAFDDLGTGGLQFDNGECGVAMFEMYEATTDAQYLDSARKSADWALERPLCPNWNYNSFSVRLLAKAHAVTGEAKYLDAAIHKARLGVIPGQLTEGPRAGRWIDAHNARPPYHYIMMCALAQLVAVLPPGHEHRAEIIGALMLGLKARNSEMVSLGVMNKDHALEALLFVNHAFASDVAFLYETKSVEALRALALLVSAEAHRGKFPISPGPWGQLLEYISQLSN